MADVKITSLPLAGVPNNSAVVPCVVGGVTRKLSLENLKAFLEIPTQFLTLVIGESPITTSPSDGITGEGSIGILPSSSSSAGSMSSAHFSMLDQATQLPVASKLVARDNQGSFEANNIVLRAPGTAATAATGTLTGNLSQRNANDDGVNSTLGKITPYPASVTTLNASGAGTFATSLAVTAGPLTVGGTSVSIAGNGDTSFSGNMTIGGNVTLGAGKRFVGAVNAGSGSVFDGAFAALSATGGLQVSGGSGHILQGPTTLNGNLTFDASRTLSMPGTSSLSSQTITATTVNATTFVGNLTGNASGSAASLAAERTISLSGNLAGSAQFDGTKNITINATVTSIGGAAFADNSINQSKLQTITEAGKVTPDAISATSSNTGGRVVVRDSNGGFSAGTITASLNGTASLANSLSSTALSGTYNWTGTHTFPAEGVQGDIGAAAKLTISNGSGQAYFRINSAWSQWNVGSSADGFFLSTGGSNKLTIDTSGNLVASQNVTAYSDERLKSNWSLLSERLVEELSSVKSGTFEWVKTGQRQVGVSAQDLQKVLPEAILEDSKGYLSVSYGNAALAVCVELSKEIVKLKQKVQELEQKV